MFGLELRKVRNQTASWSLELIGYRCTVQHSIGGLFDSDGSCRWH